MASLALGLSVGACGNGDEDSDNSPASAPNNGGDVGSGNNGASDNDSGSNGGAGQIPFPGGGGGDVAEEPGGLEPDSSAPEPQFNPYIEVSHDPFSTFAADVDTASYDIFAKTVTETEAPPDQSFVRSEEWINYFRYQYAAPEIDPNDTSAVDPFKISLKAGPSPVGDTTLLHIGVQGVDRLDDRPRANLVFLVDVSGSMGAADKLPLVRSMLLAAAETLRVDDTIALVTYSGSVRVALESTPVENYDKITEAISNLSSGGSTAGGDGLNLAYEQVTQNFIEDGINHILICTDGDFNVGPSTNEEILEIVEARQETGVTFTALGFGRDNLNDSMMEAISNAGNGIYRVISGQQTAERYVEYQILSDIIHIAKDVKLQVEFNPEYVLAYRQVGYENRQLADDDFRDDTVDAGEIGSGHQMTALYELVLAGETIPDLPDAPDVVTGDPVEGEREISEGELAVVKLRYKNPGASESDPAQELREALTPEAIEALEFESQFVWSVSQIAGYFSDNPFAPVENLRTALSLLDDATDESRVEFRELVSTVTATITDANGR